MNENKLLLNNSRDFTEVYKKYEASHPALLEAMCLSRLSGQPQNHRRKRC